MNSVNQDIPFYRNFDELAEDVIDLAKEILPDKLIYLSSLSDSEQVILKVSDEHADIAISEGMTVPLENSVCHRINFKAQRPLQYPDVENDMESTHLRSLLLDVNIKSYLGLPISQLNGERFGTLCVADSKASEYDDHTIKLLQRIVRLFTYYLELERRAYRDPLTDLYNRHYLVGFFDKERTAPGTLFFLDLDGFKGINDTFGHDRGDEVLKEVANRLRHFVAKQEQAFAVRLGGDEFIVHRTGELSEPELLKQADELLDMLNKWEPEENLSASMGIIVYELSSDVKLPELLRQADQALYKAKSAGKNRYYYS